MLGTPPAFVLSQDQTLRFIFKSSGFPSLLFSIFRADSLISAPTSLALAFLTQISFTSYMFVCLDFSSRRCTLFTFLSPFLLSLPGDYVPRFWDSFKSIALCFSSVNTLFKFFSSPLFSLSFLLFCSFCFPFHSFPVNYFKNNLLPRISCPKRTYRRKQKKKAAMNIRNPEIQKLPLQITVLVFQLCFRYLNTSFSFGGLPYIRTPTR